LLGSTSRNGQPDARTQQQRLNPRHSATGQAMSAATVNLATISAIPGRALTGNHGRALSSITTGHPGRAPGAASGC
jgi:hypothetical protein